MERLTKRIDLGNGKTTVDFSNSKCGEFLGDHKAGVKALFEKLANYEDLEEKLEKVYGECDGLLETAVNSLVRHEGAEIGTPAKARLLTDEDVDKWLAWKDAEEQGLLLKLPCKVGDAVYFTDRKYDRAKKDFVRFVHNGYVKAIKFSARPTKVTIEYEDLDDSCGRCKGNDIHASNIGKTVFLTKEEAEQTLAKMKEV